MGLGRVPGGWRWATCSALPPCAEAEAEALTRVGQGSRRLEGWWLKLRQFHGLLVKRFHCARRNSKALSSQILLPAFFVCVAMTVALSVPEIGTCASLRRGASGASILPGWDCASALLLSHFGALPAQGLGTTSETGGHPAGFMPSWSPGLELGPHTIGIKGPGPGAAGRRSGLTQVSPHTLPGDLPPLVLSPSQYHNYTQPRGNFIPYANEERREYR